LYVYFLPRAPPLSSPHLSSCYDFLQSLFRPYIEHSVKTKQTGRH
jgi:hypothetical protein